MHAHLQHTEGEGPSLQPGLRDSRPVAGDPRPERRWLAGSIFQAEIPGAARHEPGYRSLRLARAQVRKARPTDYGAAVGCSLARVCIIALACGPDEPNVK